MLNKLKSFLFHNTSAKQTVAKNSFWLAVSNFGGRAIKAGVIVYAARVLGTAGYGVFSYAITLSAFLTLFMDPGVNAILVRDVSKADESERQEIFATSLAIKSFFLPLGAAFLLFVAPIFSTLPGAKAILPIVAAVLALDTVREFFTSILRAEERMEWDAGIYLLTNFGVLVFGFIFLGIRRTPGSFTWAYVAADAAGIMLAVFLIRKYFRRVAEHFSARRVKPILSSAWPFAVTGVLSMFLTNADILIISWMRSASDVGIYSAAIRIVQFLYLVPTVFQISTLPLLSRLANPDGAGRFRAFLERTVKVIFLAAVPLAVGGAILGTSIMAFLFGAPYAAGGLAFKLLMVGLLFDFPAVVLSSAVFAYNRQRSLIVTSAIGGAANIAFDLLLIPRFGITGSAVATLIALALSNWYLWRAMKRINYFEALPHLGKILSAGLAMAAVTLAMLWLGLPVLLNIALSGAAYFGMLYALREPLLNEIRGVISPAQI